MKQDDIQPPRVTSGPGYPEAFAAQLETELSALRELIARQSSDGHLFDKRVAVDTPGLGEGHVKCSVCLPKAPGPTPGFPAPLPLIILLEGGGFALGQPIASLDYAKAPRYPFPHALLQAYEIFKWSISPAAERTLGVAADPSRVTVGCSAGGNLATSLSLLVAFTAGPTAPFRAALGPHFRQVAQVLVYPCLALHERYGERFARASPEAQAKSIPIVMLEKMEAAGRLCFL
ncbi:uncharacterized protein VDAG_03472 [Verticillium dahliae VdLs.17]|uniref:Alpha/beta hydrolase fold-3 domain-containing protein n=1 Tax=Verticillium dahliae (strain VdLs.17 / ATCC MYA-4575 / FGSC 10137) TaxID=498257 RepID=G2WZN0_VERDV|nr:uncharacterized protein VDAG_03472 [Verticillium dahliae VdLs.17]EGY22032.1 hypothetical protein VDAG_03472 [Verticillium dahliae VdLs.17]KAF3346608.1 Autophagy-related protein 11 [Verticillium dahliae VDG2]KAH6703875.1 hypothetical protein EV126DRAFT_508411 [Verticillium dahliae]